MQTKMKIRLVDIDKIKRFMDVVNTFESDIDLSKDRYVIDAKSTIGIFTLNLSHPVNVEIHSNDKDEIKRFNEMMEEFV